MSHTVNGPHGAVFHANQEPALEERVMIVVPREQVESFGHADRVGVFVAYEDILTFVAEQVVQRRIADAEGASPVQILGLE